jgi:hypothetical protein
MLTLELVSKKRKPIKRYTFLAIIFGFLLLFLVGSFGNLPGNSVNVAIISITFATYGLSFPVMKD